MQIPVVENPVNAKRRRPMTALQRQYFGKRRNAHVKGRARRRNPDLMTLGLAGGNPRRRRRRRNGLELLANRRRRHYRNPKLPFGLGAMFDTQAILGVSLGIFSSKGLPNFVKNKVWTGMPTTGLMGYGARLLVTIALSQVLKMAKQPRLAHGVMTGGTAAIVADALIQGAAAVGLSGLGDEDITADEMMRAIEYDMSGYVFSPKYVPTGGIGGYVTTGDENRSEVQLF